MTSKLGDYILRSEKIEKIIHAVQKDPLLTDKFSYAIPIWANDEHVRKVYLLVLFFAANAFMRIGLDGDELLSKVFRIAASISPSALNADEIRELMQQSITADTANNMDRNAQDLRQHDLMMPLSFHMLYMTDWSSKPECREILLKFAGKFDMGGTMRDILNKNAIQERKDIFDAKLNEQQQLAYDAQRTAILEKRRQKEESLKGASPQKRYTDLYFFDKEHNLSAEMLNDLDALINLSLTEQDFDHAADWLYESIQLSNSPERRDRLLDLYKNRCPEGQDPTEFAYSKMIQLDIEGAREDYESYREQKKLSARQAAQQSVRQSTPQASSSDSAAGCGCLLFLIAIVVWFFWPSSDKKQEAPEPPPVAEQQQKKDDKPAPPVVSQKEMTEAATKAFLAFHENITKHDLQKAYSYLGAAMQETMQYDGWASGFQTTVSSTPNEIKAIEESPNQVVLSYSLKAVDNPGGEQVFTGRATMQNKDGEWKISDMQNQLVQPAPPVQKPSAPVQPPPPPPKPAVSYKTFTDEFYGFSFEYPASFPDLEQSDSNGGRSAIYYQINIEESAPKSDSFVRSGPSVEIWIGTTFADKSSAEEQFKRDIYLWADNKATKAEMLDPTSYVFEYREGSRMRKVFYMGKMTYYIELRRSGKLSSKNEKIVQHIVDSFQPNS